MMPLITVKDFQVSSGENGSVWASCVLTGESDLRRELWFEVLGLPQGSSIDTADAFFAPSILFAVGQGSNLRFEVPISDGLAQQAHDIAFIFNTQLNLSRSLTIETPSTVVIERTARGGITGFSGGVDSWFSLKENFFENKNSSKKIKYLLVNDVGAITTEKKKAQVLQSARDVAGEFGLGLVYVTSNMSDFLSMDFQKTHTARNASVAHLLTSICDVFYYASADTYRSAGVFPTYSMSHADAILLPLLSSDSITLRSTGSSFSRAEKTRGILTIPEIGKRLDICVNHNHPGAKINCGHCWKCMRTALTLESLGALSLFEPAFDLAAYAKHRRGYIREISLSDKAADREAFALAVKSGLTFPQPIVQAEAASVKVVKKLKKYARLTGR